MRHRRNGANRLIRRFPTASLLAAAWLSPLAYAQDDEPTEVVELADESADTPAGDAAEEAKEESPELSPEMAGLLEQLKRDNPHLDDAVLEQIKAQLERIELGDTIGGDAGKTEDRPTDSPIEPPADDEHAPDPEALIRAEQQRREAEALIAELADADDQAIARIERSLAELGEASLVPLKLAALSDDFDMRTRAGAMARRLRWRLVCSSVLLHQHPNLPAVMAGEDRKPRREMIDGLISAPQAGFLPLFVECLADRDQYIRERGIDGMVLIGETFDPEAAGRALQQAALNSDDKSVVLLSVAGLGEIGQADIDVLTQLFEKTEHAEVQRTVLMTAGYTRNSEAIGLIQRALKDPRWRVRAAGLEALEDIYRYDESSDLGNTITPLLTDPEPFIRANALRLVAKLKTPGAAANVWKLIEDGSIEESAGLETLASLQDRRAYERITALYEAATEAGEHDDAARWLTYLSAYEKDAGVDKRLNAIIKDAALRPQWTTAIYLASDRSNEEQFVPAVAPLLLDEDPDVRATVWTNFGRYSMSSYQLPAELDRGLAQGDPEQRTWRINLIYQSFNIKADTALFDALDDEDPAIVNRALAMIGSLLVEDSFGQDDLPYRREASEAEFLLRLEGHTPAPKPEPEPKLNDAALEQVRQALTYKDPLARVRAAALLYTLDQDRGEQVNTLLKEAIRSGAPGRMAAGLFAARAEHGGLLEGVDLLKIGQDHRDDTYLLTHLCVVMLQVGDAELVDAALAFSEGFEIYRHQDYFISLASSGSQPAIDLVKRKVLDEGRYYGRRMIEQLVDTNPDAAIDIGQALLESPDLDSYDRRDIISNLIRTKKNDKLIPLLKQQIKLSQASSDSYEKRQAQYYQQLLLSIDPASIQKQIIGALRNGNSIEQREAISTLIQIPEPGNEIVEMVLQVVLEEDTEVDPSWGKLVGWLNRAGKDAALEQAIDQLPAPIQSALVAQTAGALGPEDLPRLLAIKPASGGVRDRVTLAVAELTTKHPQARPASIEALTPTARVYLLSAAGQWEDGAALVSAWLDHDDAPTADAALRGLAVAHLLAPEQNLPDANADRFAKGVTSADDNTAYLCAEALRQLAPDRLLAIDPNEVKARLALLCIGCAGGGRENGPVADAIRAVLTGPSDTQSAEARLALIAAIQSDRKQAFTRAWQRGRHAYAHHDLVAPALRAFQLPELLQQAVYFSSVSADDPEVRALAQQVADNNKGEPDLYLGMFLDRGLIETVPPDQAGLYLQSYALWAERGEAISGMNRLTELFGGDLTAAKEHLHQRMQADPANALNTALLAYQLDRDEQALQVIKQRIATLTTQQIERESRSGSLYSAIAAITHAGGDENAEALIALFNKLDDPDNWQARWISQQTLQSALTIAPGLVREQYQASQTEGEQAVEAFIDGDPFSIVDLLNADAVNETDSEASMIKARYTPLTQRLQEIKRGNQTGGAMADLPWDYYLNLEESEEMTRAQFTRLERDLTLAWVQTGEYDQEQTEQYSLGIYYFQDDYWASEQPYFEQLLLSARDQYYDDTSVIFSGPDVVDASTFYAAADTLYSAVPLSAVWDESIRQLAPLIGSEDPQAAARAVRVASVWRATMLKEALISAIARPDAAGLEAAWASARLFGPDALQAVLQRAQSSEDYDERVELACLLALLGEDQWSPPVIEDARRLLTVQQLRGRVLKPIEQFYDAQAERIGNDIFYYEEIHYGRGSAGQLETIIDGRLPASAPRWEGLVHALDQDDNGNVLADRLGLMPTVNREANRSAEPTQHDAGQPLKLTLNLSQGLSFEDGATNNLPIPSLVGANTPMLMHLEMKESALFNASLTQLSQAGQTGREFESAWQDWVKQHGGDSPDERWAAGVGSAVDALTDGKWWRRVLARERLQRLTGQAIDQPVLFDLDQWQALQQQWQSWAASDDGASARATLAAVALQAGFIETAPSNDAEELSMLVRLAGWGDRVQSAAALHRLDLWPDPDALLRAAASWQASPRAPLRAWYLVRAADRPRIYVPADQVE